VRVSSLHTSTTPITLAQGCTPRQSDPNAPHTIKNSYNTSLSHSTHNKGADWRGPLVHTPLTGTPPEPPKRLR